MHIRLSPSYMLIERHVCKICVSSHVLIVAAARGCNKKANHFPMPLSGRHSGEESTYPRKTMYQQRPLMRFAMTRHWRTLRVVLEQRSPFFAPFTRVLTEYSFWALLIMDPAERISQLSSRR